MLSPRLIAHKVLDIVDMARLAENPAESDIFIRGQLFKLMGPLVNDVQHT